MDYSTQYQQHSNPYPHAHQAQHPTQPSPVMQTQQQAGYAQPPPQQMPHQQMMSQMAYNPQYPMQTPYGVNVNPTHAAAMATAAASGYPGAYPMPDSGLGGLPQTSPRMGQMKADGSGVARGGPQSPRQNQMTVANPMMQPPRRMSQVGSAVQNSAAGMHASSRHGVPPQSHAQQHQSPEAQAAGPQEEAPLYVNAKQFHRILKRRMARQKLEEAFRLTNKGRKPYLHESRHNHAMRRPRGPGGRFLTADEVSAMEARGESAENHDASNGATQSNGKRKAGDTNDGGRKGNSKRSKSVEQEDDEEEEDPDEDG